MVNNVEKASYCYEINYNIGHKACITPSHDESSCECE